MNEHIRAALQTNQANVSFLISSNLEPKDKAETLERILENNFNVYLWQTGQVADVSRLISFLEEIRSRTIPRNAALAWEALKGCCRHHPDYAKQLLGMFTDLLAEHSTMDIPEATYAAERIMEDMFDVKPTPEGDSNG